MFRLYRICFLLLLFLQIRQIYAGIESELVKKGKDYFGLFQYDKAIEHFEKALQLSPKNSEAHYYLGLSYRKLNNFDKALYHFEKALQIEPSNEDYQKVVASIYVASARESKNKGDIDKTISFLIKACKAYPKEVHNWNALFELMHSQGRYNEILNLASLARQNTRDIIEEGESKDLQNVFVIAALAAKKVNDITKVKEYTNLAARFRHRNDVVIQLKKELETTAKQVTNDMFAIGKQLYQQKKYKEALEMLQKAKEIEPQNGNIVELIEKIRTELTLQEFLNAAIEAESQKKYDIALEKLYKAKQFDENNNVITSRIASITSYIEKLKKAEELKRAKELELKQAITEKQAKINTLLTAAAENEKKLAFDAAIINYEQLLEIEPNNEEYKQKIEQVRLMQKEYIENKKTIDEKIRLAEEKFKSENYYDVYDIIVPLLDNKYTPLSQILPIFVESCIYLNKLNEAQNWLDKMASIINIDSNELKFLKGLLLYYQGDYEKARENLYEVYNWKPNYRNDLRKIVWHLWYEKYKYGLFLSAFLLLIYFSSFFMGLYKSIKQTMEQKKFEKLLASGNANEIISALEKKLQNDIPNQTRKQYLIMLAENYLKVGKFQDALRTTNEVLQKDMKNPMALRIQAEAFYQLKETSSEALEKIYNLYKLDESRKELVSFLSFAYKQNKAENKSALEILHKHIALFPDDTDTVLYLANLYFKRQNYNSQNVKIFERAVKIDPEKAEYVYGLIECLKQSNKNDEADKIYNKALEKWPTHPLFTKDNLSSGLDSSKTGSKAVSIDIDVTKFYKDYVIPNSNKTSNSSQNQNFSQQVSYSANSYTNQGIFNVSKNELSKTDAGITESNEIFTSSQSKQSKEQIPYSENMIICVHCSTKNSLRDYYCVKCGKPIR